MLQTGRWYEPDEGAVPERTDEERARDERHTVWMAAKGFDDWDEWPTRRHALAVQLLIERVVDQFGVGAEIELRGDGDGRVYSGRVWRAGIRNGCYQVFFLEPESDEFEEYTESVNCEIVTSVRVVPQP